MRGGYYTDTQFNHILDVLILYKKCCPDIDVYLSEASIRSAVKHFQSTGMFDALQSNTTPPLPEPPSDTLSDTM